MMHFIDELKDYWIHIEDFMKKNIVMVVSHLGLGGSERVTTVIANSLINTGNEVTLIVFSSKHNEYVVDKRINVIKLPEWKLKVRNIIGQINEYKKTLKKLHPDYVIALTMYRYIFLSSTINKCNYILSERNDPSNHSFVDINIQKYLFKRAKMVVFQTPDAKNYYQKSGISNSVIIPNPIKSDLPDPYIGRREKKIIAFSRLTKQKNIPMLLRAFKKFSIQYPEYTLEIYGVGEMENELKRISADLEIADKVCFMGYSSNVHERIKTAEMFISSSDYEGISNSMIEAMAMGLPTICTDCPCGGARMMIEDGVNGLLISVGNEEALVDKMIYIVENPMIADSLGREAQKIRKKLSTNRIVAEWEKLLY